MEKLSTEHLSLAGEYAVASELCKRGWYAQLTLGTRKSTDILLDAEPKAIRIQVKSKQGERWPSIKGVSEKNSVLVMVDYHEKETDQKPDFYIITAADWKKFVKKDLAENVNNGQFRIDESYVPVHINKSGEDDWRGIALYPEDVEAHKGRWDKIVRLIKGGQD